MEPIKIVDKLTLRQEALRMGVELSTSNVTYDAVASAKKCETYLQGSADLPEYVDENARHKEFTDALMKLQDNFKLNPWISVDSEMKPAKGVEVLCALHYGITKIEYVVMYYNPEEKVWCGGNDEDNTNHVVAWSPIHPFTQPTL